MSAPVRLLGEEVPDDLPAILTRAVQRVKVKLDPDGAVPAGFSANSTLLEIANSIKSGGLRLETVLAEVALEASRGPTEQLARAERDALKYLVARRPAPQLRFTSDTAEVNWSLNPDLILRAVREANLVTEVLHDLSLANGVPIFELLGLRNLSAFVGEIFKAELWKLAKDTFLPNPHQDGYPDLMALTPKGRKYIEQNVARMSDKTLWSPYPFGGVEIKATVGSTPPASKVAKPNIGDPRWMLLTGADWKAHHQQTNNLIGIFWDFISNLPTVLAVFYRNDLTVADWGNIVQPREGGGRTTSVSIMRRDGVRKMGQGWIVLPANEDIRGAITKARIFDIGRRDIDSLADGPQ